MNVGADESFLKLKFSQEINNGENAGSWWKTWFQQIVA